MKFIKVNKSCRYADPGGPHLPQVVFVKGLEYEVSDALAASICDNGDGRVVKSKIETKIIKPESNDPKPESKDIKTQETQRQIDYER